MRGLVVGLVAAILAVGCQDSNETPLAPPVESALSVEIGEQSRFPRPSEAEFHRLGRQVPEFGGLYLEESNLVVLLTSLDAVHRIRQALEGSPILFTSTLSKRQMVGKRPNIVFEQSEFSFVQLARWRDELTSGLGQLSGLEFIDLDDRRNRIVLGVTPGESIDNTIVAKSDDLGIPADAVLIEETEPVDLQNHLTLENKIRPIRAA